MLSHNMIEGRSARVELSDFSAASVRHLLQCVYTGMVPSNLTAEDLEQLIRLADMYELLPLAMKCADLICMHISEESIIMILEILGRLSETNRFIEGILNNVIDHVQNRPSILRTVCMFPSKTFPRNLPVTKGTLDGSVVQGSFETTCRHELAHVGSKVASSSVLPLAEGAQRSSAENSSKEDAGAVDEEKQAALLESFEKVTEQENSQLAQALVHSKRDMPDHGFPLSCDGVVILRLTRKARHPEVHEALTSSPMLAHCHQRVLDAGCSIVPEWACGARLLVPLTEEQFEESGCKLADIHVVALAYDLEHIKAALRQIRFKDRPKLTSAITTVSSRILQHPEEPEHIETKNDALQREHVHARPSDSEEGAEASDGEDDLVEVVLAREYVPTDSSFGFPENRSSEAPHV